MNKEATPNIWDTLKPSLMPGLIGAGIGAGGMGLFGPEGTEDPNNPHAKQQQTLKNMLMGGALGGAGGAAVGQFTPGGMFNGIFHKPEEQGFLQKAYNLARAPFIRRPDAGIAGKYPATRNAIGTYAGKQVADVYNNRFFSKGKPRIDLPNESPDWTNIKGLEDIGEKGISPTTQMEQGTKGILDKLRGTVAGNAGTMSNPNRQNQLHDLFHIPETHIDQLQGKVRGILGNNESVASGPQDAQRAIANTTRFVTGERDRALGNLGDTKPLDSTLIGKMIGKLRDGGNPTMKKLMQGPKPGISSIDNPFWRARLSGLGPAVGMGLGTAGLNAISPPLDKLVNDPEYSQQMIRSGVPASR